MAFRDSAERGNCPHDGAELVKFVMRVFPMPGFAAQTASCAIIIFKPL